MAFLFETSSPSIILATWISEKRRCFLGLFSLHVGAYGGVETIFSSIPIRLALKKTIEDINALGLHWIKNRSPLKNIVWNDWYIDFLCYLARSMICF
ncbi:hypothetical protein HanRHA438_Chr08g0346511 [Helianthus annuus]|nr:hypothetical protein HanRHA438_Chr08g0346511 [Helianthus annuus]